MAGQNEELYYITFIIHCFKHCLKFFDNLPMKKNIVKHIKLLTNANNTYSIPIGTISWNMTFDQAMEFSKVMYDIYV